MVTYKLYLIRHGMTEGNRDGKYVGWQDLPLCSEGKGEIADLISKHDYPYVEEVYTSPLTRCIETAEMIYPAVPTTVVEDLKEMSMGMFEGKSFGELAEMPEYQKWMEDSINNQPPESEENGQGFAFRIANALNNIFINMSQNNITRAAVVTHGGVIMSLMSSFAVPKAPMSSWAIGNGCGFEISMSTQLWMRDNIFEATGLIPIGCDKTKDEKVIKTLNIKD